MHRRLGEQSPREGGADRLPRPPALTSWLLAAAGLLVAGSGAAGEKSWRESFDEGRLDPTRWVRTQDGDFRGHAVDVVAAGAGASGFRLRLRADTRGTRDDTVKFLGAGTVAAFPIADGTRISVEVDWNDQANGSYLSAALILAPEATRTNPLLGPDWLKVEYVGVPPGRNARRVVGVCVGGRERTLDAEGWPETNREGRRIGVLDLTLVFRGSTLELWENAERRLEAHETPIAFATAHVYLQLSSHSNYPAREVFFDDLRVSGPR